MPDDVIRRLFLVIHIYTENWSIFILHNEITQFKPDNKKNSRLPYSLVLEKNEVSSSSHRKKAAIFNARTLIKLKIKCLLVNNNLLLTEREGRTGEYWPEVVAVRTERSEVRTKTTEGQYSPVRLEQARLVSSLLYGTRVMLVSKLPAFENKKYTSYDHFHGNGPYGKIPTKKEPIRTPGFTPRLPCHIINTSY